MDLSTLPELVKLGARYYDHGHEDSALAILRRYGADSLRIRLWNDPYSETGTPYGAGTNDYAKLENLARQGKDLGYSVLLDFHYSDFWTDPGKQILPKAWQGLSADELEKTVYTYTADTLTKLKKADLLPEYVQVGNEVTNGLLWPLAHWETPETRPNIARFLSAGIRAVREIAPDAAVMLHLDCGGNNERCREWFDAYLANGGADFDMIGLSYYPFWHGTLDDLSHNMNDLSARYDKDIAVAEVSMGFTMDDYQTYEQLPDAERKGMATKPHLAEKIDYPMTKQGQADFMRDIMRRIADVPNGRGKGFWYWEAAWIPVPGCGWANLESCAYMNDPGPGGNEWANQALFDYDGNANPALEVIRDF